MHLWRAFLPNTDRQHRHDTYVEYTTMELKAIYSTPFNIRNIICYFFVARIVLVTIEREDEHDYSRRSSRVGRDPRQDLLGTADP